MKIILIFLPIVMAWLPTPSTAEEEPSSRKPDVFLCSERGSFPGETQHWAKESPWEHPTLTTHGRDNHPVRTRRHRYTCGHDGSAEFYDHKSYPNEWTNPAKLAEYSGPNKQLAARFPATNANSAIEK